MKRLLLLGALLVAGAAHAQTTVWSCMTNCSATSNTYNDGAFRAPSPAPNYVATTSGTQTDCSRNWWNTAGAVRWRRPADLQGAWCVARKVGNVESFAPASSFGWPPVTTPPPPPPNVRATFAINRAVINVGESVTVTWSSTDATSCSSTWAPSVPLSGSAPLGPFTFAQSVSLGVTCRNSASEYGASVTLVVQVPPPKSPPCWPHAADVFFKRVRFADLETPHPRYSIKATFFCATPQGPRQQTWATSWEEIFERAVQEQSSPYSEEDAAAQCEATCEEVTGALKDELDAFARQFTVDELGVIE